MGKRSEFASIRSGSSLIKVRKVDRDQLAEAEIERIVSCADLPRDTSVTYQDRKLAFFAEEADRTCFRFVQLDRDRRIAWDILECSNSAAAIAHSLAESGQKRPASRLYNVGSNQEMILYPEAGNRYRIRYLVDRNSLAGCFLRFEHNGPFRRAWLGDLPNAYLFALTENASPPVAAKEIAEYLRLLESRGLGSVCHRKILVFSPTGDRGRFRAFCQFRGDLHRSIPGTGAMWLGALLTFNGFGAPGQESHYSIEHPRGVMETRNNLSEEEDGCEWWLECMTQAEGASRLP